MSKAYNVLDPDLCVHSDLILEASAGTGKTFTIEHLVARLLCEADPQSGSTLELEQILVLTFTRAATKDLVRRIRSTLENHPQRHSINRLRRALLSLDKAQIYTIHGFCARALHEQGGFRGGHSPDEQLFDLKDKRRLVHRFLRVHAQPPKLSMGQLQLVLRLFMGKVSELERQLLRDAERVLFPTLPQPPMEAFEAFCTALSAFFQENPLDPDLFREQFWLLRKNYKKVPKWGDVELSCGLDLFLRTAAEACSHESIDALLAEGFSTLMALSPSLRRQRSIMDEEELCYAPLFAAMQRSLTESFTAAADGRSHYLWMVQSCSASFAQFLDEEGGFSHDSLLLKMREALENESFRETIRDKYKVAIVDEFQDTDPLQWEILERLFRTTDSADHKLILVGDPKQAIYAFRQADIYTYLNARDCFDREKCASLMTNYRSHSALVEGINLLFGSKHNPDLIALPHRNSALDYPEVEAAREKAEADLPPDRAPIHFFIASAPLGRGQRWPTSALTDQLLLPYLVSEIGKLIEGKHFTPGEIAILVRDRYQASEVVEALTASGIPARAQRQRSLLSPPGLDVLLDLLHSLVDPSELVAIKQVLAGPLFPFTAAELVALQGPEIENALTSAFQTLRELLERRGIVATVDHMLEMRWPLLEGSLEEIGDRELHCGIRQLCQLVDSEFSPLCDPFLLSEQLLSLKRNADPESFPLLEEREEEVVRALTIHSSKGLEYPCVFALGLCKRSRESGLLFRPTGTQDWRVADENSGEFTGYLREVDAEKVRQGYVAMTRAREMLYVPLLVQNDEKHPPAEGEASIGELLLARCFQSGGEGCAERCCSGEAIARLIAHIENGSSMGTMSYQWIDSH